MFLRATLTVILGLLLAGCFKAHGYTDFGVTYESTRTTRDQIPSRPDCERVVRRDREYSWKSFNDGVLTPDYLMIEEVANQRTAGERTRTRVTCRPQYGDGISIRGRIGEEW